MVKACRRASLELQQHKTTPGLTPINENCYTSDLIVAKIGQKKTGNGDAGFRI